MDHISQSTARHHRRRGAFPAALFACAVLLSCAGTAAARPAPLFEPARLSPFAVGKGPADVLADDDGSGPLLVAERGRGRLAFYKELAGRVKLKRAFDSPVAPTAFAGRPGYSGPLALVDTSSDRMRLFNGPYSSLSPGASLQTGARPSAAVYSSLDPFNGGGMDLVVANRGSDDISIFSNGPNGYELVGTAPVGDSPSAITANYNTALVTWVANKGSDSVTSLFGYNYPGPGLFAGESTTPVGRQPSAIIEANFGAARGDYQYRIAVANKGSDDVTLLRETDPLGLEETGTYRVGDAPTDLIAINADNQPGTDLAVVNSGSDSVTVLLNNGDGTLRRGPSYPTGKHPVAITNWTFNRYFTPDLAVANAGSNDITVLLKHEVGLCNGRPARLRQGTEANDLIRALPGPDQAVALGGNDDIFTGRDADCVSAGPGRDLVDTSGGGDRIHGGGGRDHVFAGGGRDLVNAKDGVRDRVDCGPGRDEAVVDSHDVTVGCEQVQRS